MFPPGSIIRKLEQMSMVQYIFICSRNTKIILMDPFHTRQDGQNNMFSKPFDSTHAMTGVSFSNPHKSVAFSKGGHLVIADKSGF